MSDKDLEWKNGLFCANSCLTWSYSVVT